MKKVANKHVRDLRIDNRMQRVWVLRETEERILYIPVKSMHRVDYDWFVDNDKRVPTGSDFLNLMAKTKAKNGQNVLKKYDAIIQVVNKINGNEATRLAKPDEAEKNLKVKELANSEPVQQSRTTQQSIPQQSQLNEGNNVKEPDSTDPRTLAQAGVKAVYEIPDKNGNVKRWEAKKQGPYPVVLQEKIEQGFDPSDFRVQ